MVPRVSRTGWNGEMLWQGQLGCRQKCSCELGLGLRFHDAGWRQSQCQERFFLEVSGFLSYPAYYKAWLHEEDSFPDLPGASCLHHSLPWITCCLAFTQKWAHGHVPALPGWKNIHLTLLGSPHQRLSINRYWSVQASQGYFSILRN